MRREVTELKLEKSIWWDEKGEHTCLFTDMRVINRELPNSSFKYKYEVRHDDDCQGDWAQIKEGIMVNFWGTIFTEEPIDFNQYTDQSLEVTEFAYTGDLYEFKDGEWRMS